MNYYFSLLEWLAANPLLSILVVLAEFTILAKLHHKWHNKYAHIILGVLFTPQNIVVNAIAVSIIGLELPRWDLKEFPTTLRMKRWKKIYPIDTKLKWWRFKFATTICKIVNWSDVGHC